MRLDGRDNGSNARLRQPEPAVPPVPCPQMKEAATVRSFESVGMNRLSCDAKGQGRAPERHLRQSNKNVNENKAIRGTLRVA